MTGNEVKNKHTNNQETLEGSKYFPEAQHKGITAWVESTELIKLYLDRR